MMAQYGGRLDLPEALPPWRHLLPFGPDRALPGSLQ